MEDKDESEGSTENESKQNGSEGSTENGSKQNDGTEKGERFTCSRTAGAFYDYCRQVKVARESTYKARWNERLQGEAIKRHKEEMDEEERKREDDIGKENDGDNVSGGFDADIMNGCWGGSFGADELPITTTTV